VPNFFKWIKILGEGIFMERLGLEHAQAAAGSAEKGGHGADTGARRKGLGKVGKG